MRDQHSAISHYGVIVLVVVLLSISIALSFKVLLSPTDTRTAKTLIASTNTYEEGDTRKGTIYDRNGEPLIASIVIDNAGAPVYENGHPLLLSSLEVKRQSEVNNRRLLVDDATADCWSPLLSSLSGGLDYDLADILQDIPLDPDDTTDVEITIDGAVQRDLCQICADRGYASACVLDLTNGSIIAMGSSPSYDYNSFRSYEIPYTTYRYGSSFVNNVDNTRDCVQDVYKAWKKQFVSDNRGEDGALLPEQQWAPGPNVKGWISKCSGDAVLDKTLMTAEEAKTILDLWNETLGTAMSLQDCETFSFIDILREEQAFYDEAPDGIYPFREPEGLGSGDVYIPFVKVTDVGGEACYIHLYYGCNNFLYSNYEDYGFDPNFSMTNYALQATAPGSCFKILSATMLLDLCCADETPSAEALPASEQEPSPAEETIPRSATGSLFAGDTLNITNENVSAGSIAYLPTWDVGGSYSSVLAALKSSSNNFFSMASILLDRIIHCTDDTFFCSVADMDAMSDEEVHASAKILEGYYESRFCLNQRIPSYFRIPMGTILADLGSIEVKATPDPAHDVNIDGQLYYSYDDLRAENPNKTGVFVTDSAMLKKRLGDTGYGMGADFVSPMNMAMYIGKALTGTEYVPNILLSEEDAPKTMGEPFFDSATPERMRYHLGQVYAYYEQHYGTYIQEPYAFDTSTTHLYAKTGTSSVNNNLDRGTQAPYGLFAKRAGYPVQSQSEADKYQHVWFVGAVEQGDRMYAIVVRSMFDTNSGSLINEFVRIANSLARNGMLD